MEKKGQKRSGKTYSTKEDSSWTRYIGNQLSVSLKYLKIRYNPLWIEKTYAGQISLLTAVHLGDDRSTNAFHVVFLGIYCFN